MSVTVFGSCNADIVTRVARLPRPGETVAARSIERLPGGKGANQAIAAARFGADVQMVGAVGDDALGEMLLQALSGSGVDIAGVRRIAGPSGTALVTVEDSGENQIVVVEGANGQARFDPLSAPPRAGVFLAQLEVPLPSVGAFLSEGRRRGVLTMLNTAPAIPEASAVFPLCDVVIFNQTEFAAYAGCSPEAGTAEIATAARLMRHENQLLVITLGADGAMAVGEDMITVPGRPARVVDTTGAGDVFCGVLAAMMAGDAPLARALETAVAAASLSVEKPGAAGAAPGRDDVLNALA